MEWFECCAIGHIETTKSTSKPHLLRVHCLIKFKTKKRAQKRNPICDFKLKVRSKVCIKIIESKMNTLIQMNFEKKNRNNYNRVRREKEAAKKSGMFFLLFKRILPVKSEHQMKERAT